MQNQQSLSNQENQVNSNSQSSSENKKNKEHENEDNKNNSSLLEKLMNLPEFYTKPIQTSSTLLNILLLPLNLIRYLRTALANAVVGTVRFCAKVVNKVKNKNNPNNKKLNSSKNNSKENSNTTKNKQTEKTQEDKKDLSKTSQDMHKETPINNSLKSMQVVSSGNNSNLSATSISTSQTHDKKNAMSL